MSEKTMKSFDELTIVDDFMFGAVMSEPDNLRPLLEYILGIKISQLTYPERQKTIDLTYGAKGIRLDVYCEDDQHTIYSIEIQVANQHNLAKRIRYYHSMIDLNTISKGENFNQLKKSYVIFICCFDPFGKKRYMYSFRNQCQELPKLYLDDETYSIILNVNGTAGTVNKELRSVLRYMAGQKPAKGYAQQLDRAVKVVKSNRKWRRDYMTLEMKINYEKEIADFARVVSVVRNGNGVMNDTTMMQVLNIEDKIFNKIVSMIKENPDMGNEKIAEILVNSGIA